MGEFADIVTGKLDANAMKEDGEYDFYTSGIQKYKIDVPAFDGPAITIAGNGATVGYMHLANGKFNAYQRTYVLSAFQANREFLFYEIGNKLPKKIAQEARTGNIPYIVMDMLTDLQISIPSEQEQSKVGELMISIDNLITLHQRKFILPVSRTKMTISTGILHTFTNEWEQRKLGEEFERVNERNNGQFGITHWISVAKMYYQEPDKVQSNNLDTRTYVMRKGDIAFEGHPNSEFQFGRFVANDIGDGIISELFPIYRHKVPYENSYWKYAIQIERVMRPIYAKAITSSGASSNKLNEEHFLRESIFVPKLGEQRAIGGFFTELDNLITLHQCKPLF